MADMHTDMDKIELEIKLVVLSNRHAKTQSDKHREVAYSQMQLSEMGQMELCHRQRVINC